MAQTEWDVATGDWFVDGNWTAATPDPTTDALIDNGGTASIAATGAEADLVEVANGILSIDAGGTLSNGVGRIGDLAGGTGSVTVSGAGTEWINDGGNTNDLVIGDAGKGTLEISDGGRVISTNGAITSGAVTLSGGNSRWENDLDISVGRLGESGSLTIQAGGVVENGRNGRIAFGSGAQGTVTVTGTDSGWSNDEIRLGEDGNGALTVNDGGSISSINGYLASGPDSTATATINGNGSSWVNEDEIVVGEGGVAEMTISGGGTGTIGNIYVGFNSNAQGTMSVTGANSMLDLDSFIVVGGTEGGSGSLSIEDGAGVRTGTDAGIGIGGTGTVTVTGADSELAINADMLIGDGGTGTLTLESEGRVMITGTLTFENADSGSSISIGTGQAPGELDVGTIDFATSSAGLAFDHTGTGHEFTPALTGNGSVSILAGTTILNADSDGFDGSTDVVAGSLIVNGALGGDINVQDNGTLGGTGLIGPTVLDGTVAPGESTGTLSANGDFEFGAGATYRAELGAPGDSDHIAVDGNVSLDGGLELIDAGGLGSGTYTILAASGDLTDNGLEILDQPAGLDTEILVGADTVTLEISQVPAVSLDATELDLGTVAAGEVSSDEITLTNTGQADLDINEITGPGTPFSITGGDCTPAPVTVPPDTSCTIEVSLEATGPVAGPAQDEIALLTNAPSSPDTISLTGEIQGLPIEPVPALGTFGYILLAALMTLLAAGSITRFRHHGTGARGSRN